MEKYMAAAEIGIKIVGMAGKVLIYPLLVWMFFPLYDFILPIIISDYALLGPYARAVLEDIKIILGVLIAFSVLIKLIYGVIKIKKEVNGKQ